MPGRLHRGTCAASCTPGHANTLVNMQTPGHMFHHVHPHTRHQALVPPEGSHTSDIHTHKHIHCPGNSQVSGSWLHAYQNTHTGTQHKQACTHTQALSRPSLPTVTYAGKLTSMLTRTRTVAHPALGRCSRSTGRPPAGSHTEVQLGVGTLPETLRVPAPT